MNLRPVFTIVLAFCSQDLLSTAAEIKGNMTTEMICVNDYLFTIKCTMSTPQDSDYMTQTSYWLEFQSTSNSNKLNCTFGEKMAQFNCTFNNTERFTDAEDFHVLLYKNDYKSFIRLKPYIPVKNIQPMKPCNLTVYQISDGYNFTWNSGYENITPKVSLTKNLKYKLRYYKREYPNNAIEIHPVPDRFVEMSEEKFEPGTEYLVEVSSSPTQQYYRGYWSEWSHTVLWRTRGSQREDVFLLVAMYALPVFVTALLVSVCLCLKTRLMMKTYFSIPSPAPFFQSLYSNYKGDFQCWLTSEGNLGGPLNTEEILKIDTLIAAMPTYLEESCFPASNQLTCSHPVYLNPCTNSSDDAPQPQNAHALFSFSFLMPSPSDTSSQMSQEDAGTNESDSRSGEQQCWPCCTQAVKYENTWCTNEYCTLSGMQQELLSP